jgi:hypothetical protein
MKGPSVTFDELKLRIESRGATYRVLASTRTSQISGEFEKPFSDHELESFRLRASRERRTRESRSTALAGARTFGRRLFEAVFAGQVRDLYHSSRAAARAQGHGLRITLCLSGAPDLMDVPWEYLYEDPSFLAVSVSTPIVRYLDRTGEDRPLKVEPPLRLLALVSSPADHDRRDAAGERRLLQDALEPLRRAGALEITWLEHATLPGLSRMLQQAEFHVLHYVGHGSYDPQAGDGLLVLEDEHGLAHGVSGDALGTLLRGSPSLRLAVLNAAGGDATGRAEPLLGVAAGLVAADIPAAVTTQFELSEPAASAFAHGFYHAIATGRPVDAALAAGRLAVFANRGDDIEWGAPVLFMGAPDGQVFDLAAPAEAQAPAPRSDVGGPAPGERPPAWVEADPVLPVAPPADQAPAWLGATASGGGPSPAARAPEVAGPPAKTSARGPAARRGRWASTLLALAVAAAAVIHALAGGSAKHHTAAPGAPPSGLPPVPAAWPATLTLGVSDSTDTPQDVARKFGTGTLMSEVLAGDAVARQDWSQAGARPALEEATSLQRAGLLPFFTYYVLLELGRAGRATDLDARGALAALRNPKLMRVYWTNVTELLRELGASTGPAVVEVDPPMWALIIAATRARDPRRIPAAVAPSGVAGARATLAGFTQSWVKLRDRYAPHVMLAYPIEDYAFADAIDRLHPTPTALAGLARRQGAWYHDLGAHFDLSVYELDIRDFGHDPTVIPLRRDYAATAAYIRDYVKDSGTRLVIAHIPAGNTLMRSMNNTRFHWRDNHPQLMLGDPGHAYLRTLRDAGVIGLEFGANGAPPDVTCPCDAARDGVTNPRPFTGPEIVATSADDDGGYLAQQVRRYNTGTRLRVR